jgi:precorrin-2 methylase
MAWHENMAPLAQELALARDVGFLTWNDQTHYMGGHAIPQTDPNNWLHSINDS